LRKRWLVVGVLAVLAFCVVLWQIAVWTRSITVTSVAEEARSTLSIYVANLASELKQYESLPRILATNKGLIRLLLNPEDHVKIDIVNRYLEKINGVAKSSDIFLMNTDGLTIAASNWNLEKPFLGNNFGFRPYFQEALRGRIGRYFALGTTSNKRGYYFAAPVVFGGEIIGAVAVKVSLSDIENTWSHSSGQVIVTDPDGVVFVSSNSLWKFKTLSALSSETLRNIKESLRYGNVELKPLPVVRRREIAENLASVRLEVPSSRQTNRIAVREYLFQSEEMPEAGWTVHILTETDRVNAEVRKVVLLAGFVLAIVALISVYLVQRRINLRERMLLERRAAEALQRAHDDLEQRVKERTADLLATNERLESEMVERQRAEEARRKAQDETIHAGKLAALGQMAAAITHELNQPLAAIRTYADNARTLLDMERQEEVDSNLSLISQLTARMAKITGHLKTFARKSSGHKNAPVSLETVMEHALSLLEGQIEKMDVEVVRDVPAHDVFAMAEIVRLEQVMVNLCRNALDAMKDSSVRQLHLKIRAIDREARVTIGDTGEGIPKAQLRKVFDPFFTTKEIGEGLGLGLSISYAIVEGFGGSIRATNRPGGGAEFNVVLRRAMVDSEKVA
jgi:two-component system, NtrC family, C4-dicarboxylate transport sensor histidine kinase DctB